MTEWISVKDRLPIQFDYFFVLSRNKKWKCKYDVFCCLNFSIFKDNEYSKFYNFKPINLICFHGHEDSENNHTGWKKSDPLKKFYPTHWMPIPNPPEQSLLPSNKEPKAL